MKIQKFREYLILEGNTPEDYMKNLLNQIKSKLEPVFDPDKVKSLKDFKNANLQLMNTPEVDNFATTARTLKYKFSDDERTVYELTFTIDLKDAINSNPDDDYKTSEIKKVHVGFKKYTTEGTSLTMIGELLDRTINPDEIGPDFLIQLKLDLDKGKPESEEEEFKIETGKEKNSQSQKTAQQPAEESEEQTQTQDSTQGQA